MGPDPAVAAVRLAVRRALEGAPPSILVACSGGADSLALLAAAVFEVRRTDRRIIGVTVDHALQEGSADHAARVVAQMAVLGAHETVSARVQVRQAGQGPEAAAREARYAVLEQVAEQFSPARVLLGHTLDDQAETVLMGLTRGSGGGSLKGMRPGFGIFERPLLKITRAQTEAACRAEGIEFWTDPHNSDPRFLRSRVRHAVMPLLEQELGPGVAAALARTGEQLWWDQLALEDFTDRAHREVRTDDGVDAALLETYPVGIQGAVLREVAIEEGCPPGELFKVHISALLDIAMGEAGGRQIHLPGKITAYREGRLLKFRPTAVAG